MAIAIIPARGGSRRIPGKNIRDFCGKPIIAYSIETALQCGLFDKVVVSTDHKDVGDIAQQCGAAVYWRAPGFEMDDVGTQAVTASVLRQLVQYPPITCCIYPTAPMLEGLTLRRARHALADLNYTYVYGVDPVTLQGAGQFYMGESKHFLAGEPLETPRALQYLLPKNTVCDINTEEDWQRAEAMYLENELLKENGNANG